MEIILYSRNDCPRCAVLKEKLKKKNINFKECSDIEEMQKLGIDLLPILKIENNYLDFSKAIEYINKN